MMDELGRSRRFLLHLCAPPSSVRPYSMHRTIYRIVCALGACLLPSVAQAQCWPEYKVQHGSTADQYGLAVALKGDLMAVGAHADSQGGINAGAVFILERDLGGAENWGLWLKLVAADSSSLDWFGRAVALEGDLLFVGAYGDDDSGLTSGSVYVFDRNLGGPGAWGLVTKITASDGETDDQFGLDLQVAGDVLVVGAFGDDDNGSTSGAAYVFERNQGGADNWGETKKLTASDGEPLDWFGHAVDVDGDTVVVGAYGDDDNGLSSGSAYIFERDLGGPDNWGQVTKKLASNGGETHQYGLAVAIVADTVVIGAQQDVSPLAGQVYIYERDLGGAEAWGESAIVEAPDGQNFDSLGSSLAFTGDLLAAGAWRDDDNGDDSGTAYIFSRNIGGPDSWGQIEKLGASDGSAHDWFGMGIAADASQVVVGAPGDDDLGSDSGSVYVYTQLAADCNCNGIEDALDIAAATSGDFDMNGVPDECEVIQSDYCFCGLFAPPPCTNLDPSAGCGNSTGSGALLSAGGSSSVSRANLSLSMRPLRPNEFGLFFMASNVIGPFTFGDGLRCAGGTLWRFNVINSGPFGILTLPDVFGHSIANFGTSGQLAAGQTWNFQGWYRDPGGPCGSSFNLTQAKSITFTP